MQNISVRFYERLERKRPPDQNSTTNRWQPASAVQIERIVERFSHLLVDRDIAMAVCSVIRERAEERWNDQILLVISDLAQNHNHPRNKRVHIAQEQSNRSG